MEDRLLPERGEVWRSQTDRLLVIAVNNWTSRVLFRSLLDGRKGTVGMDAFLYSAALEVDTVPLVRAAS